MQSVSDLFAACDSNSEYPELDYISRSLSKKLVTSRGEGEDKLIPM